MALPVVIQNYVYDAAGNGVTGATVTLYPVNLDGTLGTAVGSQTTAGGSYPAAGRYTFNVSSDASPSGKFVVKEVSGTDVRWRDATIKIQVDTIYGANGFAPLAAGSVRSTMLEVGAATDTIIGNRSINDAIGTSAPTGGGTLSTLLSWLGRAMKAISGESNWYTAPSTGTLKDKVRNGGNLPRVSADTTLGSASETGHLKVVTSGTNTGIWYWGGSSWTKVADVGGTGSGGSGTTYGFRYVKVGSSTIAADAAEDTLTLVAGTNISLTPNTSGDTITISASSGSGGGTVGGQYPYMAGMDPGSSGAPNLATGPWKIQAGSSVVNTSGAYLTGIPLTGRVNGVVTVLVTDGDFSAHSSTPLIFSPENVSVSPSGTTYLVVKAQVPGGASWTGGALRVNWLVVHW